MRRTYQRSGGPKPIHGHRIGGRLSPEYKSWASMKERCYNPKAISYPNYGGRGITVCPEWADSYGFEAFLRDLGPRPKGHSLDRIDNSGNYEPGNCRWATKEIQSNNRRQSRYITAFGETKTLSQWAETVGVPPSAFWHRLMRKGLSPEKALNDAKNATKRQWRPKHSYGGPKCPVCGKKITKTYKPPTPVADSSRNGLETEAMAKGETIHIRLEENLRERLARMARTDHRSLANLIEKILIQHLDQISEPTVNGHAHAAARVRAAT